MNTLLRSLRPIRGPVAALITAAAGILGLSAPALALTQPESESYLRVRESDDGNQVELDVAARAFEPVDGNGPRIILVGAAHIADSVFYRRLQYLLDAQDVVLFEGVGIGDPNPPIPQLTDDEAQARDLRRARLIGAAIVGHKSRVGNYPADFGELFAAMEPGTAEMLRPVAYDGDEPRFEYEVTAGVRSRPATFTLSTGEITIGPEDLAVRAGAGPDSMASEDGIQRVLARTLGVKFQLDAMDYSQAHWLNCDVTLEELEGLLDEAGLGGEGDNFLSMMAGGGLMSAIQGPLLGMLGSSPSMRGIVKLVLIDVLGQAEGMMESMPGPMGDLMDVLLHARNDHVIDRLHELTDEPTDEVKSIGVFYGAAHLAGIEQALVEDMGYRPVATHWVTSMGVDMDEAGVNPAQARSIRSMIRESLQAEFRRMGNEQPN